MKTPDTAGMVEETLTPAGIRTFAGRTRAKVKLLGRWHVPAPPSERCPFETRPQTVVANLGGDAGWRVLENTSTPFTDHLLVVPDECWSEVRLRTLGSERDLETVLRAVAHMAPERGPRWLGVHVGRAAGQNVAHLHYHLIEPMPGRAEEPVASWAMRAVDKRRVVARAEGFTVVAAGARAGQCLAVPDRPVDLTDAARRVEVARFLHGLVSRCGSMLSGGRGGPPDFTFAAVTWDRCLHYCTYVPILNSWGFTEYLAMLEGTPVVLPWPHEVSAAWLRGESPEARA